VVKYTVAGCAITAAADHLVAQCTRAWVLWLKIRSGNTFLRYGGGMM
jgi:hypothetical protein